MAALSTASTRLGRLETIKKSKVFRLWDIPVFVLIVLLVGGLLVAALLQKKGDSAAVYINNKLYAEYSLAEDGEYTLVSADKKYQLVLVIKDGKAYVRSANCPDHICEASGKISRVHQSIACVPARIVIRIVGESDTDGKSGGNNE